MADNEIELNSMTGGKKVDTEKITATGKEMERTKIVTGVKGTDGGDITPSNPLPTSPNAIKRTIDSIVSWPQGGDYVNLTASGQVLAVPGQIIGFYVNSTGGGTVRVSNALTATTPYLGAAITPAIGWHKYPVRLSTGGYVTIGGTIDVTFFVLDN